MGVWSRNSRETSESQFNVQALSTSFYRPTTNQTIVETSTTQDNLFASNVYCETRLINGVGVSCCIDGSGTVCCADAYGNWVCQY